MDSPAALSHHQLQSTASDLPALQRPLSATEQELLAHLDRLKHFLATAPQRWANNLPQTIAASSSVGAPLNPHHGHPALNRFLLPSGEYVSCVLWSGLYHITGTDIVRALVFRFEAFGRPVVNMKKFEEGVFSDLRNLKPGTDACLEEPKSPFLDLLFKYQCIRTQKKQKVFYWFSVPHDRLFLDALERDLKREKMGLESTTVPKGEPARSFSYDPKRTLYEQFLKPHQPADEDEADESKPLARPAVPAPTAHKETSVISPADIMHRKAAALLGYSGGQLKEEAASRTTGAARTPFLSMFSLFEGSPTYKQRRKKASKGRQGSRLASSSHTPSSASTPTNTHRRNSPAELDTSGGEEDNRPRIPQVPVLSSTPGQLHPSLAPHPPTLPTYGLSTNNISDADARVSASPPQAASAQSATLFTCPLYSCRATFRQPEYLKRHMLTHRKTVDRRFTCGTCKKAFGRLDNLEAHTAAGICAGNGLNLNLPSEETDELDDGMFLEADVAPFEVVGPISYEDDEVTSESHQFAHNAEQQASLPPAGLRPLEIYTGQGRIHPTLHSNGDGQGYLSSGGSTSSPYASHTVAPSSTSAETSPYVDTPDGAMQHAQWAAIRGAHHSMMPLHQRHTIHLDVHPHSYSPGMAGYHPSSAPAQKATFDHGSLYPPYQQSLELPAIRRHRSATPCIGGAGRPYSPEERAFHMLHRSHSRPTTSEGGDYPHHPGASSGSNARFAYSIDGSGHANSTHSSPLSYGHVTSSNGVDGYDYEVVAPRSRGDSPHIYQQGLAATLQAVDTADQSMQQFIDLDGGEAAAAYNNGQTTTFHDSPVPLLEQHDGSNGTAAPAYLYRPTSATGPSPPGTYTYEYEEHAATILHSHQQLAAAHHGHHAALGQFVYTEAHEPISVAL